MNYFRNKKVNCEVIKGNFGNFVGQRMNFANWRCFVDPNSTDECAKEKEDNQNNSLIETKEEMKEEKETPNLKEAAAKWIGRFV